MNAVTRSRPGHWADQSARFMDLMDGDSRVSLAEQQDYMPTRPKRIWQDSAWFVVSLCLSPLLVVGGVSLIAFLIRT